MHNPYDNLNAEQIRQQMNQVRRELYDDMDQVVEDANSLGDVRAYVKAQPVGWLIAAAVAGFAVVPAKKKEAALSKSSGTSTSSAAEIPAPKKSIIGAALGMAATMGTRLVINKLAATGMGLLDQSQARQPSTMDQGGSESYNQEPYTG